MEDFGTTGSNDALKLSTGVTVNQYETNRATFSARGFEIQLTQIDGLGMTNDWGTVIGKQDTFLFDKIELIRGANGLLTGVGNASGTINYVRKRPLNADGGEVQLTGGSYHFKRAALDYNKVLSDDGKWAGRVVMAHEDKDSHLRALNTKRTSLYGVVDGQIGENGVLTLGVNLRDADQDSPMWGSLTLLRGDGGDGSYAEFDVSTSTSQDWTFWNTKSTSAFIEYTHLLSPNWEAKLTYNIRRAEDDARLFYAFSPTGALNADNTGLVGWPYYGYTEVDNDLIDANINGDFDAFGREHHVIAGVSYSTQKTFTDAYQYDTETYQFQPLPAVPYGGDVYPEPEWFPKQRVSDGEQKLTRLYAATHLSVTDQLKAIAGINAFKLAREGSSRYGSAVVDPNYPDTDEQSPYFGLTYDLTDNILGYVSYSDIFQNQDQTDINGAYLDPMKGVNVEAGLKAEWLDQRLLTTLAFFTAEQQGLGIYGGVNEAQQTYYVPADVESKGVELEVVGRVSEHARVAFGVTSIEVTGPDDEDAAKWIPRTTVNARFDTRLPALPKFKFGFNGRWQSETEGRAAEQDAYFVADAFASYDVTEAASLRLNINNLFDEKYLEGLAYGAIYAAPVNGLLTFSYQF